MGVFIVLGLIIGCFVAFSIWKAHDRIHFANEREAYRNAGGGLEAAPPSWASHPVKSKLFFEGVARYADNKGIPPAYTYALLSQEEFGRFALGIIGAVERQGSLYSQQQLTCFQLVKAAWDRFPEEDKAKLRLTAD